MAAALRFLGVTSIDHEPATNWDDLLAEAPRGDGVSWTQFLSNTHLAHILPDILPKEQHIHHLHETDSVQAALALFLDKHINGAPVLDGKLVKGSVTLLDCIVFELGTGGAKSSLPVKDIMNLSGRSESPRIDARASVLVALALLTRPEVSALCIVDEHEHIKAYLTASSLMTWLAKQARARLPARALHTKVADFKTQVIKPVVSVSSSKTLDHALEAIWRKAINAVAVVDEHDRLVGTISASDLKHFDVSDVPTLTSHLKGVYINAVLQQQAVSSSARLLVSGFTGPASQLTCTVNDSIELLLDKIEHRHVHRIWVVDEASSKPIGVISIGDLMAEIARQ